MLNEQTSENDVYSQFSPEDLALSGSKQLYLLRHLIACLHFLKFGFLIMPMVCTILSYSKKLNTLSVYP